MIRGAKDMRVLQITRSCAIDESLDEGDSATVCHLARNSVHCVPVRIHVSLPSLESRRPPNKTIRSSTGSYAMYPITLAAGSEVDSCCQLTPSHPQVSPFVPAESSPPKIISIPRLE